MDFGLPHLVSLGGYLRAHAGARVEILDLNYEGGDHARLAKTIEGLGPLLMIGLSCYSSFDYTRVMALAGFLKRAWPEVPLITGGYHASALPGDVVFEGSPFDAVVVGEAERPTLEIVKALLGGGRLARAIWGPDRIEDIDSLPPYAWDLLDRYWPRATSLGRKLQIYLARGCPYRCTFCMERAKSGYKWRPYDPERAVDELVRLGRYTDLSRWVVNIADPLFGFRRRWRREVLEGILAKGVAPRQFWTLTRSDDLEDDDVALLVRARFSVGVGLESGSPEMLTRMQKGNQPGRYLDAVRRLARLARARGLNWAANVIVGHPGETRRTMEETRDFVTELFTSAKETCGWLSVDPFRLYPGAQVHQERAAWERETGAVFYHPTWWRRWYDGAFRAQHIDPSSELTYAERVNFMHDAYAPLVAEVQARFRGQGRSVDRVFERSLAEQRRILGDARRSRMLAMGERARPEAAPPTAVDSPGPVSLRFPLGMNLKDPWIRRREGAVRRLLDAGVLRGEALIEALLTVAPEDWMPHDAARAVLADRAPVVEEGRLPPSLGITSLAMGLEALEPAAGDAAADLTAASGYVAALLARMVGPEGRVLAVHPGGRAGAERLAARVRAREGGDAAPIEVRFAGQLTLPEGPWDRIWIGAALPRAPRPLVHALRDPGGRAVASLGPRFRPQDLAALTRDGERLRERVIARRRAPVLGGRWGWVPARAPREAPAPLTLTRWPAPALAYHVLAHLDIGRDAASLHDPALPRPPWADALEAAWAAAPGRLALHGLALQFEQPAALIGALRSPTAALSGGADRALAAAFADALATAAPAFMAAWGADAEAEARLARAREALAAPLARVRQMFWAQSDAGPPPLLLLDCPALGGCGRGATVGGPRRVAVSLAEPAEHALWQALHEEMHPVTDPLVLAAAPAAARDTRPGAPGWGVHARLEQVAVAATEALLRERAPEHLPAFSRWRARVGAL